MIDCITEILIRDWESLNLSEQRPRYLHFTRIGSFRYRPKEGMVTFLVHVERKTQPSLVVKIAKDKEFESLVRREHQTLTQLRQIIGDTLSSTIPRPVKLFRAEETLVSVTNFLRGYPLKLDVKVGGLGRHRKRIYREICQAASWLRLFGKVTESLWQYVPADAYVAEIRTKYASRWGLSNVEKLLFDRVEAEFANSKLVLRPAHGDFSVFNLLFFRRNLAVIDWVQYCQAAPPIADLVNFLIVRKPKGINLSCPGNLMPLHRLDSNDIWYSKLAKDIILKEAVAYSWPSDDLVNIMAVALAFSATRSVKDVGHRESPLSRRAELFRDLAQWVTKANRSIC